MDNTTQVTNANKYSLRWWFLNGIYAAEQGYPLNRTAKSFLAHVAYVAGYRMFTA